MPKKKKLAKGQPLQDFIQAGGRTGAEVDFNEILKRAVEPENSKPKPKK